jgi:hypothetical protein
MRTFSILVALACVALLFTNPDMDAFRAFAEERSEELLQDQLGDSALGRAASRFGSSLARDLVPQITERKNYGLFSVYQLGGIGEDKSDDSNTWRFLGIAGHFFELNGPEKK